jgi:D-serine dehydratase
MHHDILDVIQNIQDLYENNSSLAVLKDFERVLDEMDVYVYENWEDGELAYGPKVDRHWITAGFMWPHEKMTNQVGGKILT